MARRLTVALWAASLGLFVVPATWAIVDVGAEPDPAILYTDGTFTVPGVGLLALDVAHEPSMSPADARAFALSLLPEGSAYAMAFTLTGVARSPVPVPVRYNPAGQPFAAEGAVSAGHAGWNGITAAFGFAYLGPTAAPTSICLNTGLDGVNRIAWAEIAQPGVLGMACWAGPTECDIELDADSPWSVVDLQSVVLHEAGHCAGIGHSAELAAVMAPVYVGPNRTPRPDDVAAICAIYGCLAPPLTPTPTATAPPSTATPTVQPTATPTVTPSPPPDGVTLFRGWNLFGARVSETPAAFVARHPCVSALYAFAPERSGADPWLRYLVGVPAYVNDPANGGIAMMEPGRAYWARCD